MYQPSRLYRLLPAFAFVLVTTACSNGSGDGGQRTSNTLPSIQLDDGEVLGNGSSIVRIPATDDTGITSVSATLLRQGKLDSCGSQIDLNLAQDSLMQACLADQPTCSVEFIPGANEVVVYPPPLYAPIGLEYELSFVDRDGATTDPVRAVFCFDVGANAAPVPAADTYQLVFPSTIQRNGVIYNSRCEKQPGSDGVLANDDDDEHITNTCLRAELVELPRFATNRSTFASTFRSDGGFRYEGFSNATADSFTYQVTDGVNPPSEPVRVDIVFSGANNPPIAVNDSFTIAEDTEVQTLNVLDNDSDPDALPLSISSITNGPVSGNATIRNGVLIEYRPNENFNGTDQFNYIIVDSAGVTATARVEIQVSAVNDSPSAINDEVTTNENTPIEINVLANDSDPEGDSISVSSIAAVTNGTAAVSASGAILYTPSVNFAGIDAFEYTIVDSAGASDTATVRVTVNMVNVVPEPVEDFFSTDEGDSVLMPVLDNDIDGDGDLLEIVEIEQPSNGSAEIVGNQIRYTPNDNFNGNDSLRYRISDGALFAWAQVNINVGAVNDSPVANDDDVTTSENTPIEISVLANDTDPDGDSLAVASVTSSSNGLAEVSNDGQRIVYTPTTGFSGVAEFSYTVTDGNGGSDSADVSVRVSDTNFAPTAVDDAISTNEGSAVVIDVLNNDSDPDSDPLTVEVVNVPGNGSATVVSSGIRYTPDADFDGTDTFTYRVTDAGGLTDTASVTVTVSNVNVAPVANDDTASTVEGAAVTIDVLTNDTDPDGDALTIEIVGAPDDGTAEVQGSSVVYTPNDGFSGDDEFAYQITDTNGESDTAEVSIVVSNVNQPPVAVDDVITTEQDDPVSFSPMINDSDPDEDEISIASVTQPANGDSVIRGVRLIYSPNAGFSGTDSFQYTIEDSNGATATATVTLTVTSVNVAPVAVDDVAATAQRSPVTIDVVANDTDANSDTLTVDSVTTPDNGTAAIVDNQVLYTPAASFSGDDSFSYTVDDGNGGSDTGVVSITVSAVNNPPVAVADAAVTNAGVAVVIEVLANDTDADPDTLSIASVTAPANGSAVISGSDITYTPSSGFNGEDSFTYVVEDGNGGSDTGAVTVTVNAVNSAPVAVADSAVTDAGVDVDIEVLVNDTDPEGDTLSIASTTTPANGTATINGSDITYSPDSGFDGVDSFDYVVEDGNGGSDTGTVTVTINSVNSVPVAVADSAATDAGVEVPISVLANDTDADLDPLTIASVATPANGIASIDGSDIDYTPNADFSGVEVFEYVVEDGNGGSATGEVSVTVTAVNTSPTAVDDVIVITQDSSDQVIDVLFNDTDPDLGDSLIIASVTTPASGTAVIAGSVVEYTPAAGFAGDDSFQYTIEDGAGDSDTATVEITVEPIISASI